MNVMSESENELPMLEEKQFELSESIKLSYIFSEGAKKITLVFIHGLGTSKFDFLDAFEFEDLIAYNLVLVDLVGHGNSTKPEDFSYSMSDQADVLHKFLAELPLTDDIIIVAHSMGGPIAIHLAELLGNRLIGMVYAEGNIDVEDCFFSKTIIRNQKLEGWIETGFNSCLETLRKEPESLSYAETFQKTGPLVTYKSSEEVVWSSSRDQLLEKMIDISIPVLVIFGEENKGRFSSEQKLADKFPIIYIPEAGHAMMSQNAQKFYESLIDFLSQF